MRDTRDIREVATEDVGGPPKCESCGREGVSVDTCCSAHGKELCNTCYNASHFVEVGPDSPGYFTGSRQWGGPPMSDTYDEFWADRWRENSDPRAAAILAALKEVDE